MNNSIRSADLSLQIIIFCCSIVFSIAFIMVGYNHYHQARSNVEQVLSQQSALYIEIDQLIENRDYFDESYELFELITVHGFFAQEDRLSWGEALDRSAGELKLPSLKYSIRPQQILPNLGSGYQSALKVSESIMDIEAELLHEGDLVYISKKLSAMPGLFRVLECEMIKNDEIVLTEPVKNITLKCALGWYTAHYHPDGNKHLEDDIDPADIL